jgi:restriction endonuclease S subunit
MVGNDIQDIPVIVAGSCITLRPKSELISPKYLLLYFRSEEFRAQLESIRVGAAIGHVTPRSLLSDIKVPVPSRAELKTYEEKYEELCEIEAEVIRAKRREEELRKSLWPLSA